MSIFGKLFGGGSTESGISGATMDQIIPEEGEELEQEDFFGDEDEEEVSFDELVSRAESGDRDAMLSVGMAYIEGEGASIDLKKGMVYVIDAAEHGSVEAAGLLYEWARDRINGLGKEDDEVMRFRELGARAGDVVAQFQLAQCYARESTKWTLYQQDKRLAHFWFMQGFAGGNSFSAMGYALGLMEGLCPYTPPQKDENGLLVIPTEDQLEAMKMTDPDALSAAKADAKELLKAVADRPNAAGVIAYKLLEGFPEENPDSSAMYTALIQALEKVQA